MTIERTHHGYEAVTALPGECKRFSSVTRSAAPDSPPQAQRCLGARGEIIIKRHDDRQRLVWWSVTQPETKLTHVVSDDDVSAIRADVLCTSGSELCEVKRLSPKQGIWRRLEQNDRRQHFWPPEHGHPIGGKPWIDRESSAPNARRGHPLSCPRNRRRRRPLAPSFRSLLDRPGYGAGIPTQNPADLGASSTHVRSETANRRPVACLVPKMRYAQRMSVDPERQIHVQGRRGGVARRTSRDAVWASQQKQRLGVLQIRPQSFL
jgi:hypothetical protein